MFKGSRRRCLLDVQHLWNVPSHVKTPFRKGQIYMGHILFTNTTKLKLVAYFITRLYMSGFTNIQRNIEFFSLLNFDVLDVEFF